MQHARVPFKRPVAPDERHAPAVRKLLKRLSEILLSDAFRTVRACNERPEFTLPNGPAKAGGRLWTVTVAAAINGWQPCPRRQQLKPWHLLTYMQMGSTPEMDHIRHAFDEVILRLNDVCHAFLDRRFKVDCTDSPNDQYCVPDSQHPPSLYYIMRTLAGADNYGVPQGVRRLFVYGLSYRLNLLGAQCLRAVMGRRLPWNSELAFHFDPKQFYTDKGASLSACMGTWTEAQAFYLEDSLRTLDPHCRVWDAMRECGWPVAPVETASTSEHENERA